MNENNMLETKEESDALSETQNQELGNYDIDSYVNDDGSAVDNDTDYDNKEPEEEEYTSEYLKENTSIGGWLGFFLFSAGLSGIASVGMDLNSLSHDTFSSVNILLIIAALIPSLTILCLAAYTIYAFIQRKPNAVFFAKVFLVMVFVLHVINFYFGETNSFRGLGYAIIWFIFLSVSENVKEVIPSSFRRVTTRDWLIAVAAFIVPFVVPLLAGVSVALF